ncbi:Uncharacterized protein Rs2_16817 [Raphanus sativus]|uniref:Uncharacterized protein LOC108848024 n=1 Tax=Raphanus sativus TaxID=3726 RepID=A0A9W3DLQ8_RAPSA|nr:uncharacterized protein LOC108848024 [Raphanus sativus]KAJ4902866.1 Uncharacterized protein Rs2_16817 [Raphanus sativus]
MASSSCNRKYPPRLYESGKTPTQIRSMNHSCFLGNLQTVRENIGEDVWSELRESAVGVIIKLKELNFTWSAKHVHYFLVNQLAIQSSHEVWSLIEGQSMRFSLYEFEDVTGLNCDPFDTQEQWDVPHEEFWSWMVQRKKSSVDGLPIQRVIKKEKKNTKTMPVKKNEVPLKKVKTEKPFEIPQLNDQSISAEGWENHLKWQKSVQCRQALEALGTSLEETALALSLEEPSRRRKTQLTKTQVWPYVGNSTVKRIIFTTCKDETPVTCD